MKNLIPAWSAFCFVAVLCDSALADIYTYSHNFETSVGTEWSQTTLSTTPIGGRNFLGEFGSETVTLTLNDLPAHTDVIILFDLFILKSWDGQGPEHNPSGPDIWSIAVDNTYLTFMTTFSNHSSINHFEKPQKYPNQWPDGSDVPAFTGASEINTLGYYHPDSDTLAMDAVYAMSFAFEHTDESLAVHFSGTLTNQIWNESWGLDHMSAQVVPAPSAVLLCSIGMTCSSWLLKRKRMM